jgi:hypothetical protein
MARIYVPFALATLIVTGQAQAATPDLQGTWARISFPGFGRPLTGPGPVINKYRGRGFVGDYTNPILKPQQRYRRDNNAHDEFPTAVAPPKRVASHPAAHNFAS